MNVCGLEDSWALSHPPTRPNFMRPGEVWLLGSQERGLGGLGTLLSSRPSLLEIPSLVFSEPLGLVVPPEHTWSCVF